MGGESDRYGFAGFVLERSQQRLMNSDGVRITLTPRLFSALLLFIDRAGELLDKDTLMAALWPGLVVEENNLSQVVHGLRRALGDEGGRLIQTVPRRGFRFVASVTVLPAPDPAGSASEGKESSGIDKAGKASASPTRAIRWRSPRAWSAALVALLVASAFYAWLSSGRTSAPAAGPADFSVAVLPFRAGASASASAEPADAALAVAFARELTAELAQTRLLAGVVAAYDAVARHRGSTANLDALAKELNVRYVVDGEVSRGSDGVVVTVSLVDALKGRQLWSRGIDTPLAKFASWPALPVLRTTAAVRAALYRAEIPRITEIPKEHRSAFEHVLISERAGTETLEEVLSARASCDEALRISPDLPAALACKAWSLYSEAELGPTPRFAELAREADDLSRRAVFAAASDPYAWAVRARVLAQMLHQWDSALEANARAMQLEPSRARSMVDRALYLIWMGRPEDALAVLDRAADVEVGLSASGERMRCRAYLALGRFKDAVASCERSASQDDFWTVHVYLACAYALVGDVPRAAGERERVLRRRPELSVEWLRRLTRQFATEPAHWEQWERSIGSGLRAAGFRDAS